MSRATVLALLVAVAAAQFCPTDEAPFFCAASGECVGDARACLPHVDYQTSCVPRGENRPDAALFCASTTPSPVGPPSNQGRCFPSIPTSALPNSACSSSLSCPGNRRHCWDGSCPIVMPDRYDTVNPQNSGNNSGISLSHPPVLGACPPLPACPALYTRCRDGTCKKETPSDTCPTFIPTPAPAAAPSPPSPAPTLSPSPPSPFSFLSSCPFRCEDGECVASPSDCIPASGCQVEVINCPSRRCSHRLDSFADGAMPELNHEYYDKTTGKRAPRPPRALQTPESVCAPSRCRVWEDPRIHRYLCWDRSCHTSPDSCPVPPSEWSLLPFVQRINLNVFPFATPPSPPFPPVVVQPSPPPPALNYDPYAAKFFAPWAIPVRARSTPTFFRSHGDRNFFHDENLALVNITFLEDTRFDSDNVYVGVGQVALNHLEALPGMWSWASQQTAYEPFPPELYSIPTPTPQPTPLPPFPPFAATPTPEFVQRSSQWSANHSAFNVVSAPIALTLSHHPSSSSSEQRLRLEFKVHLEQFNQVDLNDDDLCLAVFDWRGARRDRPEWRCLVEYKGYFSRRIRLPNENGLPPVDYSQSDIDGFVADPPPLFLDPFDRTRVVVYVPFDSLSPPLSTLYASDSASPSSPSVAARAPYSTTPPARWQDDTFRERYEFIEEEVMDDFASIAPLGPDSHPWRPVSTRVSSSPFANQTRAAQAEPRGSGSSATQFAHYRTPYEASTILAIVVDHRSQRTEAERKYETVQGGALFVLFIIASITLVYFFANRKKH